jgi:3-methyladenine DNA glycosylase/8-oxoguanine DNA glycosylase
MKRRVDIPHQIVTVRQSGPFDLRLSLAGADSFFPIQRSTTALETAIDVNGASAVITVWQPRTHSSIHASAAPNIDRLFLRQMTKWLVFSDLDLRPFYRLVSRHPIMGPVASSLNGLKPLRPATLFEMAVIAITEQQLSLAAAFHIRRKLVQRFGKPAGTVWRFPLPDELAGTSLRVLTNCGLSRRKAEYVRELAERVATGSLDLDALTQRSDACIREELLALRGFGEWSVQYILSRGFGRPDALPSEDVGLRRVIGQYVARGRTLTPDQLERALAGFKPFRGLAAYYLAVHWRLRIRQPQNNNAV